MPVKKTRSTGLARRRLRKFFFNWPLLLLADAKHSERELHFHALGKTNEGHELYITHSHFFVLKAPSFG